MALSRNFCFQDFVATLYIYIYFFVKNYFILILKRSVCNFFFLIKKAVFLYTFKIVCVRIKWDKFITCLPLMKMKKKKKKKSRKYLIPETEY